MAIVSNPLDSPLPNRSPIQDFGSTQPPEAYVFQDANGNDAEV
jgi:hypothetical protein